MSSEFIESPDKVGPVEGLTTNGIAAYLPAYSTLLQSLLVPDFLARGRGSQPADLQSPDLVGRQVGHPNQVVVGIGDEQLAATKAEAAGFGE